MVTLSTNSEIPVWDLFFACDRPEVMKRLDAFLTRDPAGIVASYLLRKDDPFGACEWQKYFRLNIYASPRLPDSFYSWWFSPDPIDPAKLRSQTHLLPVFRPAGMTSYTLGYLARNPKEGYRADFKLPVNDYGDSLSFKAESNCWLVMRKDIVERNKNFDAQREFILRLNAESGANYEKEPSALDIAIVVFANYVPTSIRHLGDSKGAEKQKTYSRTNEFFVRLQKRRQVAVGGFDKSHGLKITGYKSGSCLDHVGIACLKKF